MNKKIEEIVIRDEYITLGSLLKFCHVINSGGEVKMFLSQGAVKVNGVNETRRGRKLYPDDVIEVETRTLKIVK